MGEVRYSIDKQRRLITTTSSGTVTFADISGHQDRLLADPDFDPSYDQLIDTTAAGSFTISSIEARVLGTRRIVGPDSRRAFVAVEPHIFGLGHMMAVYHEPLAEARVFYSMEEALMWLTRSTA